MIQITDIQSMLGRSLFNGAGDVVGLILFGAVLMLIMAVTKDTMTIVILLVPIMLICSLMGLISATITFVMIIVMVVIIALNASGALFGGA